MDIIQIGTVFGSLKVEDNIFHFKLNSRGDNVPYISCKCSCGTVRLYLVNNLKKGNSKSCGCSKKGNPTHGQSGTRLHTIWACMLDRCRRSNNKSYKWYGGKGIKVFGDWHTFEPFRDWANSSGYKEEMTIDRIDSSKDYTPDNCRWVTLQENASNRARKIIGPTGYVYKNADELADILRWHPQSIRMYIRKNMPIMGSLYKYEG